MNLKYALWFLGSLVISLGAFAAMNRGIKGKLQKCLYMGLFGTILGVVFSKLVYYLAMIDFMVMYGWLKSLVSINMGTFSYYGGVTGFCMGVAFAARITKTRPTELLNAFAPAGLILAALARFGEGLLEGVGTRDMEYWDYPERCFFPLAVTNEYDEWLYAVFMLEGLLTLGVFVLCITKLKEHRFIRSLFYMLLIQIPCESLRSDSFCWLFVKVEQLLCMLGVIGITLAYCLKTPGVNRRWLPAAFCFLIAGVFVVLEFALGGKIRIPHLLCYGIMIVGLGMLAVNECFAFRRMKNNAKE